MTRHGHRIRTLAPAATFVLLSTAALQAQEPGDRCCARFDYLLEKTIFKVDAVRLELVITDDTPARVAALIARHPDSSALRDSVAAAYLSATGATVRFTFERSFGLDRFLRANRKVMERLTRSGILSEEEFLRLDADNVERFQVLSGIGVRDGDRLEHRVEGERVVTRYVDVTGVVRIDEEREGDAERRVLLGSLFGPGADFRKGLLDLAIRRAQ